MPLRPLAPPPLGLMAIGTFFLILEKKVLFSQCKPSGFKSVPMDNVRPLFLVGRVRALHYDCC